MLLPGFAMAAFAAASQAEPKNDLVRFSCGRNSAGPSETSGDAAVAEPVAARGRGSPGHLVTSLDIPRLVSLQFLICPFEFRVQSV